MAARVWTRKDTACCKVVGVLRDAVHRPYRDVPDGQNARTFRGTCVYIILCTRMRKVRPSLRLFSCNSQSSASLCSDLVYRITPKSGSRCGGYEFKLIYVISK